MEVEYLILGSGVAGATVARTLLQNNPLASIAIVEAGKSIQLKDRRTWWEMVSTGRNPYGEYHDLPIDRENQSIGSEPWSFDESRFMGRGGSTVHWGGWALRFKEEDFETCSRTGRAADWPIKYPDLEPFYERAEQLLGVSGSDLDSSGHASPSRKNPYPLEPFPFVVSDRPLIHAFERLGIAYSTMPIARSRKCMTTGTCRYCPFGARFTAAYILDELQDTQRYPNFQLIVQSPCVELTVGRKHQVTGANVVSTVDGKRSTIRAEKYIIASGSYETPKLLLRSTSALWPNGIGNDQDLVGRFLVSHPFLHVRCLFPSNASRWNQELDFPTLMSRHFDVPEEQPFGKLFLFKDRTRPSLDLAKLMIAGKSRQEIHQLSLGPMEFELQGFMEEFSIARNRVMLGVGQNRIGLPQTKIDFSREDDFKDRSATRLAIMERIVNATGGKVIISAIRPQRGDHAAATCRMGISPATSVVDKDLRLHGVENTWICSNAVFPTGAAVNPSLTLTALAWRLGEHLTRVI